MKLSACAELIYPLKDLSVIRSSHHILRSGKYQNVMKPPTTQNSREAPTLFVACMMVDGVE